jgi:hypothetical protein
MAPRLQVLVGPDRFHMEPARLNDQRRPHEIDTEHFVGRVLVRIKDAPGAREGEEGREYFRGECEREREGEQRDVRRWSAAATGRAMRQ